MAERLFSVLGHKLFQLCLGCLVLEESVSGARVGCRKFGPGVGVAHIDDPDSLDPGRRSFHTEEAWGFAGLHAAPKFPFGRQQEVLIEGIGIDADLDPFAAARDDREGRPVWR